MNTLKIYESFSIFFMFKIAYIQKLLNGKYRIFSKKNENLGTYLCCSQAEKRLKQIELYKNNSNININLSKVNEFSFSAIMREMNKEASEEEIIEFLKLFKKYFDQAYLKDLQKPEHIALQNALIEFSKNVKIILNKDLVKTAAIAELGDAKLVGKYLANMVLFVLSRISEQNRNKAINKVKNKIYYLNEYELSDKHMPASSAMGQSITFIKHVLFNHNPYYIREVLNNVVKNLG